jgi:hypothetical protein
MPVGERPDLYANDTAHFAHVLETLFSPAIDAAGFELVPPISRGGEVIHADIIRNLCHAKMVLADLSSLNPNVFFELGIRTAADLPVALVCDRQTGPLPFDTGIVNCHRYDESLAGWEIKRQVQLLATHFVATSNGAHGRNALWKHFGHQSVGSDSRFRDPLMTRIDRMIAHFGIPLDAAEEQEVGIAVGSAPAPDLRVLRAGFVERCNEIVGMLSVKLKVLKEDGIRIRFGGDKDTLKENQRDQIEKLAEELGLIVEFEPELLYRRHVVGG